MGKEGELSFNEEYNIESSYFISSFDQNEREILIFFVVNKKSFLLIEFLSVLSSDKDSFAMHWMWVFPFIHIKIWYSFLGSYLLISGNVFIFTFIARTRHNLTEQIIFDINSSRM